MGTEHYHYVQFTRKQGGTTVSFHSLEDWGLYLEEPVIVSPPKPNTYMVEVPGRNGSLDLTESITGAVTYQDRELEFPFLCREKRTKWNGVYQQLLAAVHGRACTIVCSDDPEYYYEGRVTVEEWGADDKMSFPVVKAAVRPFKTKRETTVVTVALTAEEQKDIKQMGTYTENAGTVTIQFGTENFPSVDWSIYDSVTLMFNKSITGKASWSMQFAGTNYAGMAQMGSKSVTITKKKSEIEAEGYKWQLIKVTASGNTSEVQVLAHMSANAVVTVAGSVKPAIPTVSADVPCYMTVNGQRYTVPANTTPGAYFHNDDVVIREEGTTFAFNATGSTTGNPNVTISYQEGTL